MYYVYIIKSLSKNRYYIGFSIDVSRRLLRHNQGFVKSTKAFIPWEVVYTEKCINKEDALKREKQIKSYKHGCAFKKLLD